MDQVVGLAFICGLEVVQCKRNLQRAWNGVHLYDKQWSTLTYHTRKRTYHVGDANTALGSVHDVLNGAAKFVGLLLDEGPSLLNGQSAAVAMDLEGLELPALVVVDSHPLPIGLALLLGDGNCVLANCKPRPAKVNVLLGCIARGPLRYLLLLGCGSARGGGRGVFQNITVRPA
jgi:hypothetical protein